MPGPLSKQTILVVEDDADSRVAVGLLLRHWGANAILASSVLEAMKAIKKTHVDVVLSDIQMPDFDGFD